MKKFFLILLALILMLALIGCGEKRTIICDGCGKEIKVDVDSNITDEWQIYCAECEEANGLDDIVSEE